MTTIAVLGDTHMPRRARDLPPSAWRAVERSVAVIHTGDVTERAVLESLAQRRPVHAVRGNNDHTLADLPVTLDLRCEDVVISVVHDAGPRQGRRQRLSRRFAGSRVVAFGHSHAPVCDDDGQVLLLNPGSPTDRRRMPSFTMALLHVDGSDVTAEIVDLGLERAS